MKRIYFDYNATTPVHPQVREAILEALTSTPGNPSSIHQEGQHAKRQLETARRQVAALLDADPMEIYFTSGGTEANNLSLFSVAARHTGTPEVITSKAEHPSILAPLEHLAALGKVHLHFLPLNADGFLQIDALASLLNEKTALVSLMLVNNEVGTIYPVAEAVQLCRDAEKRFNRKIHVHCDGIQAVGRLDLSPRKLGVDTLSFSAHKFYGPKGVGALWVGGDQELKPLQHGGGQEAGIRSGTENIPGIVGMGCAVALAQKHQREWRERLEPLRDALEARLLKNIPGCRVNAQKTPRIFSTSNLHFPGIPGDLLHQALDLAGCAVSTGSACSSGMAAGSPVLKAMGQRPQEAAQAIRVSLGYATETADIDCLAAAIEKAVHQIRQVL